MARKRSLNALEQEAHDMLVGHQVNLLRLGAGVRGKVFAELEAMISQLSSMLQGTDLTEWKARRTQDLMRQANQLIDDAYNRAQTEAFNNLVGVAKLEYQQTLFSSIMDTSLPPENTLKALVNDSLVMGAPANAWWSRQNQDSQFRFMTIVRQGIAAGDDRSTMAQQVSSTLLDVTRSNAQSLINTSVASVASDARLDSYQQNSDVIGGVQQVSTLDSRTTEICAAYADQQWDLDGNPINGSTLPFDGGPPRHWNCRSVLVPIVDQSVLGLDLPPLATRAADNTTVAGDSSFADWLATRSEAQQNEQFGVGKMDLWRKGDITLTQMLDQRGNPMTLDELRRSVTGGT